MTNEERIAAVATAGLVVTGVGALLPWARIGGRNRSGFNTADTFLSLANGALPDALEWVGRWWYLPAFLALVAWATTFLKGQLALRVVGVLLVLIAGTMWWLFIWAGQSYNVLTTRFTGPAVATIGLIALGYACSQRRDSLLRPSNGVSPGQKP